MEELKQYIGRTGVVATDGFFMHVIVKEVRLLGRAQVYVVPTDQNSSGARWKYLNAIKFDGDEIE